MDIRLRTIPFFFLRSFIAVEHIDSYCVLISSKTVYFLKWGEYVDRDAIFLEIKYDDLYHCLVSKDHGKIYVQLTKKAESTSSGIAIPGPSHQKPMVSVYRFQIPRRDCDMFQSGTIEEEKQLPFLTTLGLAMPSWARQPLGQHSSSSGWSSSYA